MNSTENKYSGHSKPPSSLSRIGGEVPSAVVLLGLLSPKLATSSTPVYRLTPFESELLKQAHQEMDAIADQLIQDGFLAWTSLD